MTKRISTLILLLVLTISLLSPVYAQGNRRPYRIINVVFDDSGSTVINSTTWAHERYAMQLFAAMLEEKDVLNIFMMSKSVEGETTPLPDYVIKGSYDIDKRVSDVYNIVATNTRGTPFASVERAYQNIHNNVDYEAEKWLIILTDGNFDDGVDVNDKYNSYVAGTQNLNVVTLAIGEAIGQSLPEDANHIDTFYATSADKVITQLAEICNRMFSRNQLAISSQISIDVPVEEIFVLAQGEATSVGYLSDFDTEIAEIKILKTDEGKATINPAYVNDVKTIQLIGKVASIKPKADNYIDVGNYNLDISGADNINVYYKPKVDLEVFLKNENGEITTANSLQEGEYQIYLELVHPKTRAKLNSKMLGEVDYNLSFNGEAINPGDTVALGEGKNTVEGSATFLTYNEVSVNKTIDISHVVTPLEIKDLELKPLSLSAKAANETGVTFALYQAGERISQSLWENMDLPTITSDGKVDFVVKRGADVATFEIKPKVDKNDVFFSGTVTATVSAQLIDERGDLVEDEVAIEVEIIGVDGLQIKDVNVQPLSLESLESVSDAISFKLYQGDKVIAETEWKRMRLPDISWEGDLNLTLKRGPEAGQFVIQPSYYDDKYKTQTGLLKVEIIANLKDDDGNELSTNDVIEFEITDDVPLLDKIVNWIKRHLILSIMLLLLLLLIMGYLPLFKKYLPKSIKKRPTIVIRPNSLGDTKRENGAYKKKTWTTLVPYKAQEAEIRIAPIGVSPAVPRLRVKATSNRAMHIKNYKAFAGRKTITFDGVAIEKDERKVPRIRAGTMCNVKTELYTSSCTLNN